MPLQVLADAEHYVVKARLGRAFDTHEIPAGLEAHTWAELDKIPPTYVPHCYWTTAPGIFVTDAETPNPFAYKLKQHAVFTWARRNLLDPEYLAYARHGHARTADIFHAFVVMNVMAAMHSVNILGDHWSKVEGNVAVGWREFVANINPSAWTSREPEGVNYNRLSEAVGGFVTLSNVRSWAPVQDWNESGWAMFNREYGGDGATAAADIRRATNIVVVPPSDIPAWTHSSLEPVEPVFTWDAEAYLAYRHAVREIIPNG